MLYAYQTYQLRQQMIRRGLDPDDMTTTARISNQPVRFPRLQRWFDRVFGNNPFCYYHS